jgi:hypothetical protein
MNSKIIIILSLALSSSIAFCQPGKVLSYQRISYKVGNCNIPTDSVVGLGDNCCFLGDLDKDGRNEVFSTSAQTLGLGYLFSLNADGTVYKSKIIGKNRGLPNNATPTWYGFGAASANIGDLNKDGITDLAIGNYGESGYGGDVFIVFLNADGSVKNHKVISSGKNGFNAILGDRDKFGSSITNLGDIDNNKTIELVIGAPFTPDGATEAGAIWILSIDSTGYCTDNKKISHTSGGSDLKVNSDYTRFGMTSTKFQDIDGDKIPEFFVGAPFSRSHGQFDGKFYGISINADKTLKSFKLMSDTTMNFGDTLVNPTFLSRSIGNFGDIDGNGYDDIAVGTVLQGGDFSRGHVRVMLMENNFKIKSTIVWDSLQNGIPAYQSLTHFGLGLTGVGDINKDGRLDAIVGLPRDNTNAQYYGAFYVLFLDGKINFYTPSALFASKDTIKINECVNFNDKSTNTPISWKWSFQGGNPSTSSQQNPSNICFSKAGKYTITLISGNSAGADTMTKTLVVQDPAGLQMRKKSTLTISPNPFFNSTTISTSMFLKDANLYIYNTNGQLVKEIEKISGQQFNLNRDNLNSGLYFLYITQDNKTVTNNKLILMD